MMFYVINSLSLSLSLSYPLKISHKRSKFQTIIYVQVYHICSSVLRPEGVVNIGGKDNLTRAILFIIYAYATDASLPVNGRHRKIRVIKQSIRGFCRYQGKYWMNGS